MPDSKIKSPLLLDEIKKALDSVSYGSVEIYVQNKKVTQLTVRKIVKTSLDIEENQVFNEQDEEPSIDQKKSGNFRVKTIRLS